MTFLYAAALFAVLLSFLLFFVDHWNLDLVQAARFRRTDGPRRRAAHHARRAAGRPGRLPHPAHRRRGPDGDGLVLSAATLSGDHFAVRWLPLAVLIGIGVGLCYPLLAAAAVHGLASADLAAASALNQSARQLGAALGVATAVGVLGASAAPSLGRFHAVWLLAAGFSAVAAVVALLVPGGSADAATRPRSLPHPSPTHHRGVFRMRSPSLIYALTNDEDRAVLNRARASRRLLTREVARESVRTAGAAACRP